MTRSARNGVGDDSTVALDWPVVLSILTKTKVTPGHIVVGNIPIQDPPQMRLTPHDHVVEAFAADRAGGALDISVLPW